MVNMCMYDVQRFFFFANINVNSSIFRIKGKIVKSYVAGESFGEVALIEDGGRRKCDVIAVTNVDLRVLTRGKYYGNVAPWCRSDRTVLVVICFAYSPFV